ncbi:hypothetical protein ACJX0J_034142, partial [Zea mays]
MFSLHIQSNYFSPYYTSHQEKGSASKSTPEEIPLNVSIGQYGPGYHGPSDKHEEAWKEYGCSIISVGEANNEGGQRTCCPGYWQDQGVQHLHQYGKEGFEGLFFSLLQEGVQAENIQVLYIHNS